ncbi:MAG TPA: hypothetical protein VMZ74_15735 [Ramlibacter sp.]|nr:hypothetical protein [Ramlibacter sp.]
MGAFALTRWVLAVLQALPQPLHRALDRWSRERALRRRERRLKLATQRHAR